MIKEVTSFIAFTLAPLGLLALLFIVYHLIQTPAKIYQGQQSKISALDTRIAELESQLQPPPMKPLSVECVDVRDLEVGIRISNPNPSKIENLRVQANSLTYAYLPSKNRFVGVSNPSLNRFAHGSFKEKDSIRKYDHVDISIAEVNTKWDEEGTRKDTFALLWENQEQGFGSSKMEWVIDSYDIDMELEIMGQMNGKPIEPQPYRVSIHFERQRVVRNEQGEPIGETPTVLQIKELTDTQV